MDAVSVPAGDIPGRPWFFIKHDMLFNWYKKRHGAAPGWVQRHKAGKAELVQRKVLGVELRKFLQPISCFAPPQNPTKGEFCTVLALPSAFGTGVFPLLTVVAGGRARAALQRE